MGTCHFQTKLWTAWQQRGAVGGEGCQVKRQNLAQKTHNKLEEIEAHIQEFRLQNELLAKRERAQRRQDREEEREEEREARKEEQEAQRQRLFLASNPPFLNISVLLSSFLSAKVASSATKTTVDKLSRTFLPSVLVQLNQVRHGHPLFSTFSRP